MFAFLIAPQRFILSPLARRDRQFLRQQAQGRPLARRFLPYLLLIPFFILAFLPTQIYFTREQLPLLWVITASSVFLSLIVGLRTLTLAGHLMAREQGVGQWEQLILTQMDARQIVLSKWLAVMPAVWHWHILAALARLGVALGFAQLFHSNFGVFDCPTGALMFCHTSHNYGQSGFPVVMQPDLWKVALAALTLVGFALLEAMLLSALGIASTLFTRGSTLRRSIPGIGIRAMLIVFGAGLLFASEYHPHIADKLRAKPFAESCFWPRRSEWANRVGRCADWNYVFETVEIGGMGLADNGTGAAIVVMRPIGRRIFVLRHLFGAAIGMSLYVMFIWLVLRIAVFVAVRRRALRPGYI